MLVFPPAERMTGFPGEQIYSRYQLPFWKGSSVHVLDGSYTLKNDTSGNELVGEVYNWGGVPLNEVCRDQRFLIHISGRE